MFGIGDFARAFAHGIGGLGRRIKKLGEANGAPEVPSITPTFTRPRNPGEIVRQGSRLIEDSVGAAENDAREAFGSMRNTTPVLASDLPESSLAERRNLPISRRDLPIPGLTPAPSLNTLRSALPSLSSRPSPPLAAPPAPPLAVPDMIPDIDLDRRNLPIPALPGHPGGPVSYNPVDAAKYDYTMAGAERDAEGDFTGRFKRDWKQTALATLAGAARGGAATGDLGGIIGGAAAGGASSLISPQAGREFNFDTLYRPELEARQARERAEKDRMVAEIFNQAKLDDLRATTDERRAQALKLGQPTPRPADLKIGINRGTGRREFFDENDPAQRALYDPEPKNPPQPREPRPPTAAELSVDPESGLSVEEEADASYNARGGDQYVFDRLPARTRQILSTGKNAVGGTTRNATQAEIDDAQKEFERAIGRQRKTDLDYTRGVIRRKRIGAPRGGKSPARPSTYKRNVNELPPLR